MGKTDQIGGSDEFAAVRRVLSSNGRPLDSETRRNFETRFGRDFSQVRIHTGAEAATSADSISATAYTVGNQIAFGQGAYQPKTFEGRKLLAHELTHVVQQRNANSSIGSLVLDSANSRFEQEAAQVASQQHHHGIHRIEVSQAVSHNGVLIQSSRRGRQQQADGQRPPGKCTEKQFARLKAARTAACKSGSIKSCVESNLEGLSTLEKLSFLDIQIALRARCARARAELSYRCFGKADPRHATPIINEINGAKKCNELRKKLLNESSVIEGAKRIAILLALGFGIALATYVVGSAMLAGAAFAAGILAVWGLSSMALGTTGDLQQGDDSDLT